MLQRTKIQTLSSYLFIIWLALVACFTVTGCGGKPEPTGPITVTVWSHTGTPEEKQIFDDQVARFNANHTRMKVEVTYIPEAEFNHRVETAAASNSFPDLLNVDGPFLSNYVWKGYFVPLEGLIPLDLKSNLLPSIRKQGTIQGKLYAVGPFDSGLGLFGNRRKLRAIRARIPSRPGDAWKADELNQILSALAWRDRNTVVLDLGLHNTGEWYTYAFSPVVQSAGGDLINRRDYQSADGVLNKPEVVAALKRIQTWIRNGWVYTKNDDNGFVSGDVALAWAGHWEYKRYKEALGDDLVLMPLPNFGQGTKTAMGSWIWGITAKCQHPRTTMRFLRFLLEEPEEADQPNEVVLMSNASGAVPGTGSAVQQSPLYGFTGPLKLFVSQLNCCGVPRPQTPAYPAITAAFQQAFQEIRQGSDVKAALDKAVTAIDQDIKNNNGYTQK